MKINRQLILVISTALAIPIIPFLVVSELPGERWLSATDDNALRFGFLGGALLAGDALLPIPSSVIGTLLGARLGFVSGTLWTWAGLTIGHLIGYGAGRLLLAGFAIRLPETPTLLLIFASRPVPVLAEAVAFTAGAERVRLSRFFVAAAAGNSLYALSLAANGAALVPSTLFGPWLILPMAMPAIAWLLWRLWRQNKRLSATR